jgi:hypothetical protein
LAWSTEVNHPFSRGVALTFGIALAIEMGDEGEVRRLVREFAMEAAGGMHAYVRAAFEGFVGVLDGAVDGGLAAVEAAVRRAATSPLAPGQHAVLQRLQLAALLAAGDRAGARTAAERLLETGGPARLWAPLARRVLAEIETDGGGTSVERPRNGG